MRRVPRCGALAALALVQGSAGAAVIGPPQVSVEAITDYRRRGISWSDGQAAASVFARLPVGSFAVEAEALTTRGDPRHGRADAAIDVAGRYDHDLGAISLDGGVIGHLFPGAGGLAYVELDGGGSLLLGPARLGARASYAPRQDAIGGDNLHLGADLSVAVIGTPFTARAGIGRSSGDAREGPRGGRAFRLRPRGDYADYMVGFDYVLSALTMGVRFTGTADDQFDRSVAPLLARNTGERLSAFARVSF
ncbi:TorF family putative porin [uncultured Sphingomonas sp.]|uniref:TorF family putative porin n=1 Tax=uncultured Sphingomonas sp. TaxID=158754 RepID=UPI0025F9E8F4|nr:TorF family putative porin [uncultured Sphingomonas sp.]